MKLLIALLCLSLAACSSTPKEEVSETFDWDISDTQVVVVGCEDLKDNSTNPDC